LKIFQRISFFLAMLPQTLLQGRKVISSAEGPLSENRSGQQLDGVMRALAERPEMFERHAKAPIGWSRDIV